MDVYGMEEKNLEQREEVSWIKKGLILVSDTSAWQKAAIETFCWIAYNERLFFSYINSF